MKKTVFKNKSVMKFKQDKNGILLEMSEVPNDIDYVVELTY